MIPKSGCRFLERSCSNKEAERSNKEAERDDDSTRSHRALGKTPAARPLKARAIGRLPGSCARSEASSAATARARARDHPPAVAPAGSRAARSPRERSRPSRFEASPSRSWQARFWPAASDAGSRHRSAEHLTPGICLSSRRAAAPVARSPPRQPAKPARMPQPRSPPASRLELRARAFSRARPQPGRRARSPRSAAVPEPGRGARRLRVRLPPARRAGPIR